MTKYASGKYSKAVCDRCGFEFPYLSLRPEWTGLRVCSTCWEPKQPQLDPVLAVDAIALRHPRPENDPTNARVRVTGFQINAKVGNPTYRISGPVDTAGLLNLSLGSVSVSIDSTGWGTDAWGNNTWGD